MCERLPLRYERRVQLEPGPPHEVKSPERFLA
jgi:hypothetical protein